MKKLILWIVGIILAIVVLVFGVLFSPPGNALIKSIIQSQIDKYAPIKLDLETFALGLSSIDVKITHKDAINITLNGELSLFSQSLDLVLKADAKDISVFGELVDTPLKGAFVINTTIKGSFSDFGINTTSDIAKSFTDIHVHLKDYAPSMIVANIKDLQIKEILAMAGFAPYASGLLNVEADIKSDSELNLNGKASLSLNGKTSNSAFKRDFGLDMPNTNFKLNSKLSVDKNIGALDSSLTSDIATLNLPKTSINLKSFSIEAPYSLHIPSLKKLQFITGMELAGDFRANGVAKMGESIYADFNTKSLGGNINAIFNDNNLNATLKNINTTKLFEIAKIKPIFSANINGDLNYSLKSESGNLKSTLSNGKLMPNNITELAQKYLNMDLTKESFENAALNANIAKKQISADIALKSKNTSISAQNASIDMDKSLLDANFKVQIKSYSVGVKTSGDITSPNVSIDAKELISAAAGAALSKGAEKALDKIKDEKLKEGAQKLLDKLF